MWAKYFCEGKRTLMKIIKGTLDSRVIKLTQPDSIKYIQNRLTLGITGGEFAITYDEDELPIATLLGSCVAVMLYDSVLKLKGMNHFLLPTSCVKGESCRFGLYAMEAMLNEMYKLGSRKENITAKIAGGATILQNFSDNIGERNVTFARNFCRYENIKVVSETVLGNGGRVIMLDSNFETIVKTMANRTMDTRLAQADQSLIGIIDRSNRINEKSVTLF